MPAYSATESPVSAVSWSAVFAGALAIWATTLIILTIGSALGFTALSPYGNSDVSATTFQVATGVFSLIAAFVASSIGGYVAGRLRTRWVDVHTDEVYFRDTAHGLLSWALATFVGAVLLGISATAVATGAASNPANGATISMTQQRAPAAMTATTSSGQTATMTPADQEAARKAALRVTLWLAASLLGGAFAASWMATCGGKIRDRAVPTV